MAQSKKLAVSDSGVPLDYDADSQSLTYNSATTTAADDSTYQPIEIKKTPENQLIITDPAQLTETFTHRLSTNNPNLTNAAMCAFDYDAGEYRTKPVLSSDQLVIHTHIDTNYIHDTSDEYQAVISTFGEGKIVNLNDMSQANQYRYTDTSTDPVPTTTTTGTTTTDGTAAATADPDNEYDSSYGNVENLKNQFQYNARGTQTGQVNQRDKCVATEPPATSEYCAQVTKYDVFDCYLNEIVPKQAEVDVSESDLLSSHALYNSLKLIERLVNHNNELNTYLDYVYYENMSEVKSANHPNENKSQVTGSLLPLWKIAAPSKQMTAPTSVTSITLNTQYTDLFCVTYGSYDFIQAKDKQQQYMGAIAVHTLKNTSHPEYTYLCDSSVLCSDFHPVYSNILVVGQYDGNVAVYDVTLPVAQNPIYTVNNPKLKHKEAVWSVKFKPVQPSSAHSTDVSNTGYSFVSVSGDGRVVNWSVSKSELVCDNILEKQLVISSFDFHRTNPHLILLGYETGLVELYNLQYNVQMIKSWSNVHHNSVYSIQWNPYVPTIYATCSGDWNVNIYNILDPTPDAYIFSIDLNAPVLDFKWSQYSSTIFACVTADGFVRVFDLSLSKYHCIGELKLNKKLMKLTVLQFHATQPILFVGDEKSTVHILKLSTNLRRMNAPNVSEINNEDETARMDELFYVQHPDSKIAELIESATDNKENTAGGNGKATSKGKGKPGTAATGKPKTAVGDGVMSPKSRGKTPGTNDSMRGTSAKQQAVES